MPQTYRSHSRMLTLKLILGPIVLTAFFAGLYFLSKGGSR